MGVYNIDDGQWGWIRVTRYDVNNFREGQCSRKAGEDADRGRPLYAVDCQYCQWLVDGNLRFYSLVNRIYTERLLVTIYILVLLFLFEFDDYFLGWTDKNIYEPSLYEVFTFSFWWSISLTTKNCKYEYKFVVFCSTFRE